MSQTPRRTGKFPQSIFENSTIIIARREKAVWGESQTWVRNIIEIKISANTEKSSLHPSVTSSSALINYENFPFSNPKRLHPTFIFRCYFPRWNFHYMRLEHCWMLLNVEKNFVDKPNYSKWVTFKMFLEVKIRFFESIVWLIRWIYEISRRHKSISECLIPIAFEMVHHDAKLCSWVSKPRFPRIPPTDFPLST